MDTKLITDLPVKHQIAIASIATEAARLEYHIEHTIHLALYDQRTTAEYLLKSLAGDRLVGLLKALLLDAVPEEKQKVDNLIAEIRELKLDRNTILHWTSIRTEKPDEIIFASVRPFREFQCALRTAPDILAVSSRLESASRALMEWQSHLDRRRRDALRGTP